MTAHRLVLLVALVGLAPAVATAQGTPNADLKAENERLRKQNAKLKKAMEALRKAKQKDIDHLRKRLIQAEDQLLDVARRFDKEKRRLQDEKELVLRELTKTKGADAVRIARLEGQLATAKAQAKGKAKPDVMTRKVSLNFDGTPLTEVLQFLTDVTQVRHTLAQADTKLGTVQVSLRLKNVTLKNALSLIAASHPKLTWRHDGKGIVFSTKPELVTSPSGLGVLERVVGTGATATKGKTVTVHYVGTLKDGTIFDSSRARNTPFRFLLGRSKVIDGWEEGIDGMKVGGKRKLVVPPGLAYGKKAIGKIPPNSTLTFEVELLKVD